MQYEEMTKEDLIATIRDRDKQIEYWKGHEVIQILVNQNSILREALEFYAKEDNWIGDGNIRHFDRPYGVAREALAKVGESK